MILWLVDTYQRYKIDQKNNESTAFGNKRVDLLNIARLLLPKNANAESLDTYDGEVDERVCWQVGQDRIDTDVKYGVDASKVNMIIGWSG